MSVLVNPDAFPHAIRVVHDLATQQTSGLAEQEFADYLTPQDKGTPLSEQYREGRSVLKSVLREAVNLGLLREENGEYYATPIKPQAQLQAMRLGVFQQEERLTAALTWLLRQDPYRATFLRTWDEYQRSGSELQDFIGNDVQFGNFDRWAFFLKLADKLGGELRPNPTPAVLEVYRSLPHPADKQWAAEAFYQALRAELPVLPVPVDGHLSGPVSFALVALERRKLLSFHVDSDARKLILTLPHNATRAFSRVRILRSKA